MLRCGGDYVQLQLDLLQFGLHAIEVLQFGSIGGVDAVRAEAVGRVLY